MVYVASGTKGAHAIGPLLQVKATGRKGVITQILPHHFPEAEVPSMRIKEPVERDAPMIEGIFREIFGRTGAQYYDVRWDVEAAIASFPIQGEEKAEGSFVIDWLVVLAGYHGRGVGSSLMKSTLDDLSRRSKEYDAFQDAVVLARTSNWWEFTRGRRRRVPESRDSPAGVLPKIWIQI